MVFRRWFGREAGIVLLLSNVISFTHKKEEIKEVKLLKRNCPRNTKILGADDCRSRECMMLDR